MHIIKKCREQEPYIFQIFSLYSKNRNFMNSWGIYRSPDAEKLTPSQCMNHYVLHKKRGAGISCQSIHKWTGIVWNILSHHGMTEYIMAGNDATNSCSCMALSLRKVMAGYPSKIIARMTTTALSSMNTAGTAWALVSTVIGGYQGATTGWKRKLCFS